MHRQFPRALYIPETLSPVDLVFIYVSKYIAGGRLAGRPAGAPFHSLPPIRDSGFALYEREPRITEMSPASFEFEYRYSGGRGGRERRTGVYITGISRRSRRVDETKTDADD